MADPGRQTLGGGVEGGQKLSRSPAEGFQSNRRRVSCFSPTACDNRGSSPLLVLHAPSGPELPMISFSCSHCGMKLKVKPQFAGRSAQCPTRKQPLVVPKPDTTQAFVPQCQIDGPASSVHQAGVDGGVTLGQATGNGPGQKSVQE